jgi:hypothetical protein
MIEACLSQRRVLESTKAVAIQTTSQWNERVKHSINRKKTKRQETIGGP